MSSDTPFSRGIKSGVSWFLDIPLPRRDMFRVSPYWGIYVYGHPLPAGDNTFVLLSALQIWIYHPVCSCSMSELCSYALVLLSALPIWIYHPICGCSAWVLFIHFCVTLSTANLDLSSMQLLHERALLIHLSAMFRNCNLVLLPSMQLLHQGALLIKSHTLLRETFLRISLYRGICLETPPPPSRGTCLIAESGNIKTLNAKSIPSKGRLDFG